MQRRGIFLGPNYEGFLCLAVESLGQEGLPGCLLGPLGEGQEEGRSLPAGLWLLPRTAICCPAWPSLLHNSGISERPQQQD